jgi:hypothetical protein
VFQKDKNKRMGIDEPSFQIEQGIEGAGLLTLELKDLGESINFNS